MHVTRSVADGTVAVLPNQIPEGANIPDVWLKVFSFMSSKDLGRCACVCTAWKSMANEEPIWKSLFLQKYENGPVEDCLFEIAAGKMTWKEAYQSFHPLKQFLNDCIQRHFRRPLFHSAKNPLHQQDERSVNLRVPFAYDGKWQFSIVNSTDVQVSGPQTHIIKGESEKLLSHLAVYRGRLYALRTDGHIIVWDFQNSNITSQIQTAYAKKDIRFGSADLQVVSNAAGFRIQDDLIIISYRGVNLLELISTSDPNQSEVFEDKRFPQKLETIIKKDNKIYFQSDRKLVIFDLSQKKICHSLTFDDVKARTIAVDKTRLFVARTDLTINIYDHNGLAMSTFQLKLTVSPDPGSSLEKMMIHDNFLYCLYETSDEECISIVDLKTNNVIKTIRDIIDFKKRSIKPGILETLKNPHRVDKSQKRVLQ